MIADELLTAVKELGLSDGDWLKILEERNKDR